MARRGDEADSDDSGLERAQLDIVEGDALVLALDNGVEREAGPDDAEVKLSCRRQRTVYTSYIEQ
jgi:hypothetical protein